MEKNVVVAGPEEVQRRELDRRELAKQLIGTLEYLGEVPDYILQSLREKVMDPKYSLIRLKEHVEEWAEIALLKMINQFEWEGSVVHLTADRRHVQLPKARLLWNN